MYNVADQLSLHLNKYAKESTQDLQSINISLNIDGLPLFKSSNTTLWPILCSINLTPKCIFPLSLSIASSKPKDISFISEITSELSKVMQDGLQWAGRTLRVELRCITCDAPAKAMVKCVKLYSGYYGCDKCDQKGSWDGRMLYPEVKNLNLRTDRSFRECWQPEHHQTEKISPFCCMSIDMVTSFPADYMHQCCLGVMRKLLLLWTRGKTGCRMSRAQMSCVSKHLEALRNVIPDCFVRKPRGLQDLERWKATEFRQFALYTGKIVLKGVLQQDLFEHFMAFSTAMCLLVSPQLAVTHSAYAHDLLTYFVERGRILYGQRFLVYNVHSLLHLAADVVNHGSLDNFSAFQFENKLQDIKRLVRSGRNPLIQVANRLEENTKHRLRQMQRPTIKGKNNVFIHTDAECCEVISVSGENKRTALCRVYTNMQPYMMTPCDSRVYGTFRANVRTSEMRLVDESTLERRAFMAEEAHGSKVVVAILHTL